MTVEKVSAIATGYPTAVPFDVENLEYDDGLAKNSQASQKRELLQSDKPKPWSGGWHWRRVLMTIMYLGLLGSYVTYLYYRIRYTLKTAKNPRDASPSAVYTISLYPVFALCIEVLSMVAMALYAVNKTYYPARTFQVPRPDTVKDAFRVAVCVCCYKEPTTTIAETLAAAATAIREARREGLIAIGTTIWLCDDTPPGKRRPSGELPVEANKECVYTIEGIEFRHIDDMRTNRRLVVQNLGAAFPDIAFAHRLPDSKIRRDEHNGLNKKSGNLNAALREIWPHSEPVTDRDVLVVLDADQAAFPDFLVKMLPCLDAGVKSDNVALVQSPQVFEGVHPKYDIFNHQNVEFWSTLMVAYNSTGFISCAGTNFAVRATALRAAGPAPFPTHTVTEDFAFGMRLRAHNPPFSGIYLPMQLVRGTAPDTIRAAFKQRSRWTKGPFQMLISHESPFWYRAPEGAAPLNRLSIRDRICFISPVFNAIVNCLATPFFSFVPCFFIWTGRFPASLTLPTIICAMVAVTFTLFFKFFARPAVGVTTVNRSEDGKAEIHDGQVSRHTHSFFSYVLAEWNADVNIRNFWWLFAKVIINFSLRCCGIRREAGFSATVGGATSFFNGFLDVLPLAMLWFVLMASVTWAALQLYVGARLLGPLGICMAWAIYQAIPSGALMCYVLFRVRHERQKRGCCGCYEHFGRFMFTLVYLCSFILSWVCLIAAAVWALRTLPRQIAFTQNSLTIDNNTVYYFFSVSETVNLLKHNINGGVRWRWHW